MSKQQDHNPFEDAINESVNKLSRVAPSAVLYNSLLWAAVAFVTIIGFNILRPKNKIIYEPKVKYHTGGKTPPKISDGFFSWLPPLIHTKEPELLDKVGLDATTFLRFLRMMRWLFTGLSILLFAGVVPVNITQSMKRPANKRDALSILTIRDVFGSLLYVHIGAVYVVTFIVFGFVWWHWKHMVRLRNEWFASDEYQKSFYARTLMVTDVPRKMQSDEGLTSLFASMQMPYPTTSVHIGRHVGRLPELVNHHNETVRELEEHLVRYLKGGKIGKKRPTFTKGGCMGCGGQKTDAIDFYTAKLKKTEGAIEQWRNEIDTRKAENYGFASLAAVPYAHVVARMFAGKTIKGTTVTMAPNPKDIIWTNLNMSPAERARKRTMGWVWLSAFAALNTFPLLLVSFFANLNALMIYVKPLRDWANASEFTFSLASAVLPPTLSAIFGWLQPVVMRYLSRYQGATTHTRLDRAVVARYFAFLVISQLIIFSLIGVIFNGVSEIMQAVQQQLSFQEIIDNLNQLPPTIPQTYISQSNYWLTFFPLRGFLAIFDLAQIINLVWTSFKTRVFGRTPRDVLEWTQPPEFEYAIYYSNLLFMGTVGLVFAPFAPLVTVGAALVFWVSSVVYKYQLMFVFITRVESGGRLWNVIINRLLFSLILMQLLMTLTIGLRLEFKSWIWTATLPPLVFVVGFKWWLTYTFDQKFRYYLPSEEAIRNSQVHSANADSKGHRLEKRFGHPALYADLFTPMVHAKMAHLLPQVYHGNLGSDTAVMDEYDGRKMEAQILPGGIRIAAINQQDLEFDPALYGRDRGELDWDTRSVASVNMLHEVRDKMQVPLTRIQSYLSHGPRPSMGFGRRGAAPGQGQGGGDPIELSRIDSRSDAWPLLQNNSSIPGGIDTPGQMTPYHEIPHQYPPSSYDLSRSGTPVQQRSITPQGHRPMTPSQSGHGHYRPPSQQLLQSPAAYGGAQPGQVIAPGQMPPQYHQRGRSTETLGQYGAPPQQQPHHRGLSIDTLGQYGAQRPGTPGSYHERLPSANGPGGDYFGPARGASPHSPHGQQHQRMGTPTQQHPPQGWSPHSARSPSVDQLRQHQPSPGAGGYRR